MGQIGLAFKAFFKILSNPAFATRVRCLFDEPSQRLTPIPAHSTPPPATVKPPPARGDALTLLSVLQREARLIDFLKEDLTAYNDAQIGAAVRDVHRDSAATLERLFAIRPLRNEPEGSPIQIPPGFDPAAFRLTGNVAGQGPHRATLRHPGWQATKQELPTWSGPESSSLILAPAEAEV